MADLAEFLLARIGEDEALARDAQAEAPTPWFDNGGTLENAETTLAGYAGEAASPHIARWDPARVLAECEAKRRIVEMTPAAVEHYGPSQAFEREWEWCPKARTADYCQGTDLEHGPGAPCDCGADAINAAGGPLMLRLLALPYADHPDYREEWNPAVTVRRP